MTADAGGRAESPAETGREIVSERVFDAPRGLVFRAWSEPERLARWWGPKGFTNRFHAFDFRPGGEWRFTMTGPDGARYENRCVFAQISEPERIVFDHLEPVHSFRVTADFEEVREMRPGKERETGDRAGAGTKITFRMVFEDAAECQRSKPYIIKGNEENFDRLQAELKK